MQTIHTDFLIIGGGIAGLALGIGLSQRKLDFLIVEQSDFIAGIGAGIGISSNAIAALEQIDMADTIKAIANPLQSMKLVFQNGKQLMDGDPQHIKGYDQTNYALHRAHLHHSLVSQLRSNDIMTQQKCISIQENKDHIIVAFENGNRIICKNLIGADGIYSIVRKHIFPKNKIRYAGYTCWRAVIDFPQENFNYAQETWGINGRFGITPLINNQIYWYACINSKEERNPLYTAYTIEDLRNNFKEYHRNVIDALAITQNKQLIQNDISDLEPLQQYHKNNIVLIGDAAHATTPNLGQGACMGLEDAAVLLQEIDHRSNATLAFESFSKRRVARCTSLVNKARTMGSIAQFNYKPLIPVRNSMVRSIPAFIQRKQLKDILNIQTIL